MKMQTVVISILIGISTNARIFLETCLIYRATWLTTAASCSAKNFYLGMWPICYSPNTRSKTSSFWVACNAAESAVLNIYFSASGPTCGISNVMAGCMQSRCDPREYRPCNQLCEVLRWKIRVWQL